MRFAVPRPLTHDDGDFFVCDQRCAVTDLWNVGSDRWIRVGLQKIRQLHDVAISVEKWAMIGGIGHDDSPCLSSKVNGMLALRPVKGGVVRRSNWRSKLALVRDVFGS